MISHMTSAGMVMRKHLPLIMLLLLFFDLSGEEKRSTADQIGVIAGEWAEVNDVRKLYDTPEGAVYEFDLSLSWKPYIDSITRPIGAREHEKNCKCDICRKMRSGIKGFSLRVWERGS